MPERRPHRKLVKLYHEPGDFHEFTFSCYCRLPLLTNDTWRTWLARSIDEAAAQVQFQLVAFMFMPEHVHLLMWPTRSDTAVEDISWFLAAVKRPVSVKVKAGLEATGQRLLRKLTVRTRPNTTAFRFWQEGPGYDRNLNTEKSVTASIEYFHYNPVARKLVKNIAKWRWSSARWYLSDGQHVDPELPKIYGLPPGLFVPD